ncbi:hypothetical protein BZG36_00113 [Bifiguratus adelaidae]|uniref:GCF C-terminal domain-containing protein n=1 Tax=Bifiguratus adelaidae TaxID=1938954 RepID=A0A261Y8U1_9FUNG|nr:hypothetical protein BZG36_00113 [Bifiguratus adelaidae]
MMFAVRNKAKQKNLRRKVVTADEEHDEEKEQNTTSQNGDNQVERAESAGAKGEGETQEADTIPAVVKPFKDKEKKSKHKATTTKSGPSTISFAGTAAEEEDEGEFQIRKAASALTFDDADLPDLREQEEQRQRELAKREYAAYTRKQVEVEQYTIPDASEISRAKKERELRRTGKSSNGRSKADIEADYISLSEHDGNDKRLVREEDEEGDAEEEYETYVGERMLLGKKANQAKQRRDNLEMREMIEEAQLSEEDEDEDELLRWEAERLKAGGAKQPDRNTNGKPTLQPPAPVPAATPLPTVEGSIRAMKMKAAHLEQVKELHRQQAEQLQRETEALQNNLNDYNTDLESQTARYDYYARTSAWLSDLEEFLEAKMPSLESYENQLLDIRRQEQEMLSRRWMMENVDDLYAIDPNLPMIDGATNGEDNGGEAEPKYLASHRKRYNDERESRRLLKLTTQPSQTATEGMSTDDDLGESTRETDDQKLDAIVSQVRNQLLSDVTDEFASLDAILDQFRTWKMQYIDDYQKAYGALALPTAFGFWIRIQLFDWDPFQQHMAFETMHWHHQLSEFDAIAHSEGSMDEDPESRSVLPKTVEKVIIPLVEKQVSRLNVSSISQVSFALDVVDQVSYYCDTQAKAFQSLLTSILERFHDCVSELEEFVQHLNLSSLSGENEVARRCRDRLFYRVYKVLLNVIPWRRFFAVHVFSQIVTDTLVDGILLKLIGPDDVTLLNKVLVVLPDHIKSERHKELATVIQG